MEDPFGRVFLFSAAGDVLLELGFPDESSNSQELLTVHEGTGEISVVEYILKCICRAKIRSDESTLWYVHIL